jgi:hypothetical protein
MRPRRPVVLAMAFTRVLRSVTILNSAATNRPFSATRNRARTRKRIFSMLEMY